MKPQTLHSPAGCVFFRGRRPCFSLFFMTRYPPPRTSNGSGYRHTLSTNTAFEYREQPVNQTSCVMQRRRLRGEQSTCGAEKTSCGALLSSRTALQHARALPHVQRLTVVAAGFYPMLAPKGETSPWVFSCCKFFSHFAYRFSGRHKSAGDVLVSPRQLISLCRHFTI